MNLAKLRKQLLRDLKANPKKGATLALLCLAAVYFWAPLVGKWFKKEGPSENGGVAAAEIPATAAVESATSAVAVVPAMPGWQDLTSWIERDPRMSPVAANELSFDPFAHSETVVQEKVDEPQEVATVIEVTPQSAGLVLTGTMLGRRRRVAIINGKTYCEGNEVRLGDGVNFRLSHVAARQVVLERNDRRFELALAKNSALEPAGETGER